MDTGGNKLNDPYVRDMIALMAQEASIIGRGIEQMRWETASRCLQGMLAASTTMPTPKYAARLACDYADELMSEFRARELD